MGDSNGNLSQALAVLGDEKSSHISLSSKIDFLEKKGLSSSEVLDALKLASSSGALKLAGGRMKYDWVWSTVVPWVSVIGVGLVTYYFTGDCNDSEDEMNNDNLHATNDLLTQNSISISQESSSSMEVATSINKPNNTVEEPEWAKQLKTAFSQLTEDVKSLRETGVQGASNALSTGSNVTNQKPVVTLLEYRSRMHSAILKLRHFCLRTGSASSNHTISSISSSILMTQDPFQPPNNVATNTPSLPNICGTLVMYLKTALENPSVPRYRRIAIENSHFKTTLGCLLAEIGPYGAGGCNVSLCDEFMASVGFARRGAYYEWQWLANTHGQQNDSPELTSAPQYRYSTVHTSRQMEKNSSESMSGGSAGPGDNPSVGAQNSTALTDLLDRIPDDFVADAVVRECLKLLIDLKNSGNFELMTMSPMMDPAAHLPKPTPCPFPTNLSVDESLLVPGSGSVNPNTVDPLVTVQSSGPITSPISFSEVMKLTKAAKKPIDINSES